MKGIQAQRAALEKAELCRADCTEGRFEEAKMNGIQAQEATL